MIKQFEPKRFVAGLPSLPGVYRMLNVDGEALYVGKAKDLKKRVASYFRRGGQSPRISAMLTQVAGMEVTVARSEAEALLLENNLIKSLAPRYNILFRDDKSYPYLAISGHEFPRLGFHRGAREKGQHYYGPFPHANAVRDAIQLLQRVFRLRTCEDGVFENRSRPCLLHQIRRCTAPCTGLIDRRRYELDVNNARLLLSGREDDVIRILNEKMHAAATALRYEDAAACRDQIRSLARVQARQYVESARGVDADVIACLSKAGMTCVNLVMIRGGRHVGGRSFFPHNAKDAAPGEVVAAFLGQHYLEQPAPPLVLTSAEADHELLEAAIGALGVGKIRIVTPSHGERRVWLDMAMQSAKLALLQRAGERATQEGRLNAMREALGLPDSVQRIECFDISHTMGEATVASCVVFDHQTMQKGEYRRFNIQGVTPGDDYAAMRQALFRRYERLAKDAARLPDLVLIDGGSGQVAAAKEAMLELGLNGVALVGVAKGPGRKPGLEQLVIEAEGRVLTLAQQNPGLHLVQSIRDEAHRFAVSGHRAKRAKTRRTSVLLEIPGIGAKRRRHLLSHFGGMQGLRAAAVDEICDVEGISRNLAEQIHRFLHDGSASA